MDRGSQTFLRHARLSYRRSRQCRSQSNHGLPVPQTQPKPHRFRQPRPAPHNEIGPKQVPSVKKHECNAYFSKKLLSGIDTVSEFSLMNGLCDIFGTLGLFWGVLWSVPRQLTE